MNEPHEIERKYLITRPDDITLSTYCGQYSDIIQTYLEIQENGVCRRVRKRGTAENFTYTYTEKKDVSFGDRIEIEREISRAEYEQLLTQADTARSPIIKTRWVFTFEEQVFELDIYPFSDKYATLEIELDDISTPVQLPPFLDVLKDVTGDRRYSNSYLAKTHRLELL